MLPACCWKHSLQHCKCSGDVDGSSLPKANKYLFADLLFFIAGECDEEKSPSFVAETQGLMLPAPCQKFLLQYSKCRRDENGSTLPMANKYLFPNPLLFMSGEGDEAMSPSFAICYMGIDASSTVLEAFIAI